ncbi:hypothetical protein NN561_020396 [Cricetulus griseus]
MTSPPPRPASSVAPLAAKHKSLIVRGREKVRRGRRAGVGARPARPCRSCVQARRQPRPPPAALPESSLLTPHFPSGCPLEKAAQGSSQHPRVVQEPLDTCPGGPS